MASVAGAVRALPLRRWNLPVRSGTRPPRPSVCEASSHEHDAELMRKPQWSKYMHVNGCVGWAIDAPGRVHWQFDPVRSEQILLYGQLLGLSRLHVGPGSVPRTPSRAPCPDAPAGRRCPAAAPLLMRTRGAGAPKPTQRSSTRRYVHCRPPEWRCCRPSPFPGALRLIVALSGWRKAPPGSGKKGRPPRGGKPSRRLGVSRGVGGVVIPLPFPGGLVCGRCCWLLFYVRSWDSFTIRYGLY